MKKDKRQKFGGRKKGTPNKDTKELREKISDLIDNNFENIQSDIDQLEPKERLDFLTKLFEYSLPKLSRTEINADVTAKTQNIGFDIRELYRMSEKTDDEKKALQKKLVTFK